MFSFALWGLAVFVVVFFLHGLELITSFPYSRCQQAKTCAFAQDGGQGLSAQRVPGGSCPLTLLKRVTGSTGAMDLLWCF